MSSSAPAGVTSSACDSDSTHHQYFRCDSGECIDRELVCNKISDCTDNSDEPLHCCKT